ncbi:MAG: NAD(P)H-dependent oxidoreductase subunit E [Treponema sp.]|jgi:NADH-quinone oxidoreductase subunit E|nr:NAD(P)H-dependent oxidoreductase subunit E [Treponema sp.]
MKESSEEKREVDSGFDYEFLDTIIGGAGCRPSAIIPILQGVQEKYNYLPPEIFPYLAEKLRVSEARIYGVATFYENFSLEPKGKYIIKVCDGTACHVRKSVPNLERFRRELGLSEFKVTTGDLGFTVQTVACLGACSLGPALTVNNKVYAAMTPEKVSALIGELRAEPARGKGN